MSTPGGQRSGAGGWTVVVPVKALDRAKSRLSAALPADTRRALVLAMAEDVIRSCQTTPGVRRVLTVSPEPEVEALAARLGVDFVPEPAPRTVGPPADPLNAALATVLTDVDGPVGVVTADLPELRPDDLSAVLTRAADHPHAVVIDHRGVGTTMAFWTGPATERVSRFGPGSAYRYRVDGGAVPLVGPGRATRDVDIPADLTGLVSSAVGQATAAVLRHAPGALRARPGGVSATMVP